MEIQRTLTGMAGSPARASSPRGDMQRGGCSPRGISSGRPCHEVDPWADLWQMQPGSSHSNGSMQPRVFAHERALAGKYWRERLRKRGHCFFLLLEHWVRHTLQPSPSP